jgi:hypothetical protein
VSETPSAPAGREVLRQALIYFSVASLSTLEFIRNSWYETGAVELSKSSVVYAIIIVQVVPALLLLGADTLIEARDRSGRVLRVFRTAVFAAALLLIVRQLQLYWDPLEDMTEWLRSATPVLLLVAGLGLVGALVAVCVYLQRGVILFFWYMSPIAVAMSAILPFQAPERNVPHPDTLTEEVETADPADSAPAVFVLVFDEVAYDLLLDDAGELDRESFPNFARLADEGVWFTNATSNHYWTAHSIPNILQPVTKLTDDYNLRLYMQFPAAEDRFLAQCGKQYTCRGGRYLARERPGWLGSDVALRALYRAVPDSLEPVLDVPVGPIVKTLDLPYPQLNRLGFHTFTKREFDLLLGDIDGEESRGRIHFMHSLATHWPYAFDPDGDPRSEDTGKNLYISFEGSRRATMFADGLLGRLIDKLEAEGLYDDSIIAITSDHGLRTYRPTEEKDPIQREVQVPLLVRAPGVAPRVWDIDYQHIDFGPTLADLLGLEPPAGSDGVSVFVEERPEREKYFKVNRLVFVQDPDDGAWHLSEQGVP